MKQKGPEDIEKEYLKHLRPDGLKNLWNKMTQSGKFESKPRTRIINDFNFDPADMKFLEVAIGINAPVISGDSHFLYLKDKLDNDNNLRSKLRHMRILTPSEALRTLDMNPKANGPR